MPRRAYSEKTVKVLYAPSGNQCAHPDCENTLSEDSTEYSDASVTSNICHIHAVSPNGPRWNPKLTPSEINDPENLILLCPYHHAVVDSQPETYTATMLKEWKRNHELKVKKKLSIDQENVRKNIFSYPNFPIALVDKKIKDEVVLLRKARLFPEFDRERKFMTLGRRLETGEFSGGTDETRCYALAWCARSLSPTEELPTAEKYLGLAKTLGSIPEVDIASAIVTSYKSDKNSALGVLGSFELPSTRSAAFMIVRHHEGAAYALDWLKTAEIQVASLDSDGKHFVLACQFELGYWEAAKETADSLTDQDLDTAPILHHMRAMARLLSTVPLEFRAIVLKQLPFDAASFPLASHETAIDARRIAQRGFTTATEVACHLGCPRASALDSDYALWLELIDPEHFGSGRKRLEEKLRDPESSLRLVPFGLQFGIKLDLEVVGQEIDRQIALHGEITPDAAIARFYLTFTKKTPEGGANYIVQHYDELSKHLDSKSLRFLQIDLFSQAGLVQKAKECLKSLVEDGLSEAETNRLQGLISEAEGADSIETREARFKKSNSLSDLGDLVEKLEGKQDWSNLCQYGELLFKETRSIRDAERLANALHRTYRSEQLARFLRANISLLPQSNILRMFYSWALFYEGALLEARKEHSKLNNWEDPNYRTLQMYLGIYLGDWSTLSTFVAREYSNRSKRNPRDLVQAAQLALYLDSPHAKDLIFAAAEKGCGDATVLAAAYFLATSFGIEDDAGVVQWLHKAAALSGDDGPIQRMTLKDILDRKPDWERRESDVWGLLRRGEVPMFLAAESLNKSLIELMLYPAYANLSQSDPRRRSAILAYSGKRPSVLPNISKMKIGIDVTALLTLSYLNLLDEALDALGRIFIPHSTLAWLFDEKQKVTFHQPSLIRSAHKVRDLIATGRLERFVQTTIDNSNLSSQIGDELALFIAEAEKARKDDKTQRIVVRPSPVYYLSSLMEEEADLTSHASVMCSCSSVVKKLREKGQITMEEEKKADAYLQLHEKPWEDQPEISDGAVLYLDRLTITHFIHLKMLEKIKTAGLRPIASPRAVFEADALIAYESISDRVNEAIESIRATINSRIESEEISVGRWYNTDELEDGSISQHPTVGMMALMKDCEAIVSDDRFVNQHPHVGEQVEILSTLDILDELTSIGVISSDARFEYRTSLRRAGYLFIPITKDELAYHINASMVKNNRVIESAELRAIREHMLQVRMSAWLQLPGESLWLDTILRTFISVLKSLWKEDADLSIAAVRSNWVLEQIDVRGWAHRLEPENGDHIIRIGRGIQIMSLLSPPTGTSQEVIDSYWSWAEAQILAPLRKQHSDLYTWVVEEHKKWIAEMTEIKTDEEEEDE